MQVRYKDSTKSTRYQRLNLLKKEEGTPTSKSFWKLGQILDNVAMAYYEGYFKK